MKNLIYLFLTVLIVACSGDGGGDEGNPCDYNPTLTTSAVANVTETSATLNGVISIVSENCDNPTNTEQGFVYATTIQPTINNIQVNVNGTTITTTLENLEPNTTYYARAFLTNALGEFYGNEVNFITSGQPVTCDVVYLAENGITIKACEDAYVGDIGTINGVEYTVVDEVLLREMVANEEDVTKVATTRVTDMTGMFSYAISFNQDISSWDVSNVTLMSGMFAGAISFNQDISSWDVSNVTLMNGMFGGNFGSNYIFNQDISSWDVSNVTDMTSMFFETTSFNQPIGNWDVSNVTSMGSMFSRAFSFNQDLSAWDVSNVTSMGSMFRLAHYFNRPIGNWDVSNVTDMTTMFKDADYFNQDLSSWDVDEVTYCGDFNDNTPQWTQPKPNFTNCIP
ncbi:BspA family leucine-rich repeat surface protein [Winogradskyella sp.]|nr:BspA family leucine-rich repeat surface protein [Winogradskyella sp.]